MRQFLLGLLVFCITLSVNQEICFALNTDCIYYNGKVYTADFNMPYAEAFVVKDGEFLFVGDNTGAKSFKKLGFPAVNLKKHRVIPGLFDSHCHIIMQAVLTDYSPIRLDYRFDSDKIVKYITKNIAAYDSDKITVATGFGPAASDLTAEKLDKISATKQIIVFSSDFHKAVLNTAAMNAIGIDRNDPAPGQSYYQRDKNGNLTGVVVEVAALLPVMRSLASIDAVYKNLPEIQKTYSKYGYTGVFDAGTLLISEEDALDVLKKLENEDKLTMRYYTSRIYAGGENVDTAAKQFSALRKKYVSELIHPTALKLFSDGTVEAASALMYDEYLPPLSGRGSQNLSPALMKKSSDIFSEYGFDIHIHAIGDRAIDETLSVLVSDNNPNITKTLAHGQVFSNVTLNNFTSAKNVFYQTTPLWLRPDKQFTLKVLGKERYERQMPIEFMMNNGIVVTFGSDSDGLLGINPFYNIYCAEKYRFTDKKSKHLKTEDCINAYTINGAKQVGADEYFGSISPGKSADFVILNRDILLLPPSLVKYITLKKTYFCGKCIYKLP